jgi:hypothetical protein
MNIHLVSIAAVALIAGAMRPAVANPISYSFVTVDYPGAFST